MTVGVGPDVTNSVETRVVDADRFASKQPELILAPVPLPDSDDRDVEVARVVDSSVTGSECEVVFVAADGGITGNRLSALSFDKTASASGDIPSESVGSAG